MQFGEATVAVGNQEVSRNEKLRFGAVRIAVFCRDLLEFLDGALGAFLLSAEDRVFGICRRRRVDFRAGDRNGPTHRGLRFVCPFLPPTVDSIARGRNNDNCQHPVKHLTPSSGRAFSQAVGKQHRGVAEPVVLQFAGALLLVFSQGISFCKSAR